MMQRANRLLRTQYHQTIARIRPHTHANTHPADAADDVHHLLLVLENGVGLWARVLHVARALRRRLGTVAATHGC